MDLTFRWQPWRKQESKQNNHKDRANRGVGWSGDDDRAIFSEVMTCVLRFEKAGSAGQLKNGKKARWERAGKGGRGADHAGLDRPRKKFQLFSMYR